MSSIGRSTSAKSVSGLSLYARRINAQTQARNAMSRNGLTVGRNVSVVKAQARRFSPLFSE